MSLEATSSPMLYGSIWLANIYVIHILWFLCAKSNILVVLINSLSCFIVEDMYFIILLYVNPQGWTLYLCISLGQSHNYF